MNEYAGHYERGYGGAYGEDNYFTHANHSLRQARHPLELQDQSQRDHRIQRPTEPPIVTEPPTLTHVSVPGILI